MSEPCITSRMSLWDRYGALYWAAWFCVISGFGQRGFSAEQEGANRMSLEAIRQLVEKNEDLVSLIKLKYVVRFTHSNPEEQQRKLELLASGNARRKPRRAVPVTHRNGVWAQDDVKQYHRENLWYADGWTDPRHSLRVVDGEVYKYGVMPDLMQGTIDRVEEFPYRTVAPLRFGLRILTGQYALREIFAFKNASVQGQEVINGRRTCVIDATFPGGHYYIRAWIDQEAGVPLRVEYYNKHPSSVDSKLLGEIKDIQLHRLPNGGWFPIKGTRSVHFSDETVSEQLEVDVNSITIKREDIPDSLFTLEFPDGARVYNAILGLTIEGGSTRDREAEKVVDGVLEELETPAVAGATGHEEITNGATEPSVDKVDKAEKQYSEPATHRTEPTKTIVSHAVPARSRYRLMLVWIGLSVFVAAFALAAMRAILRSGRGRR